MVALRYYHGMTQQNCAKVMHVSQVQISRLERRAVNCSGRSWSEFAGVMSKRTESFELSVLFSVHHILCFKLPKGKDRHDYQHGDKGVLVAPGDLHDEVGQDEPDTVQRGKVYRGEYRLFKKPQGSKQTQQHHEIIENIAHGGRQLERQGAQFRLA